MATPIGILLLCAASAGPPGVMWTRGATTAPSLAELVEGTFPAADKAPRLTVSARQRGEQLVLAVSAELPHAAPELLSERSFDAEDASAWVYLRTTLDRHRTTPLTGLRPAAPSVAAAPPEPQSPSRVWLRAGGQLRLDGDGVDNVFMVGIELELSPQWRLAADLGVGRRAPLGLSSTEIPLTLRGAYALNDVFEVGAAFTTSLLVGEVGPAIGASIGPYLGARWSIWGSRKRAFGLGARIDPQLNLIRRSFQRSATEPWTESIGQVSATIFGQWRWL